jgi:hypothetical protein
MAFLAANKQLDLQSLMTAADRGMTKAEGWYERRRPIQAIFIIAMALAGVAGVASASSPAARLARPIAADQRGGTDHFVFGGAA